MLPPSHIPRPHCAVGICLHHCLGLHWQQPDSNNRGKAKETQAWLINTNLVIWKQQQSKKRNWSYYPKIAVWSISPGVKCLHVPQFSRLQGCCFLTIHSFICRALMFMDWWTPIKDHMPLTLALFYVSFFYSTVSHIETPPGDPKRSINPWWLSYLLVLSCRMAPT